MNLEAMSSFIEQYNAGLTCNASHFLISDGGLSEECAIKYLAKLEFSAGSSRGYVNTSLPCYVQCPIRGDAEAGRFLSANEDEITRLTFF